MALPVGVRKGMVDAMGNSHAGPVVFAPNICMDLPADASFEFVEIRARSLAEHRAWLQILDDTMRRDAIDPLPGLWRRPPRDGDQPDGVPELRDVLEDLPQDPHSQWLVGRNGEMLLPAISIPRQAAVVAALTAHAIAVGLQSPGQIRAIEVAGDLPRANSSWRP